MITIRPIDEELKSLHQPVITTHEDDIDSALDGFRVTNSGSVMIPSGFTKPLMMQRNASTVNTMSSSYSSAPSYPSSFPSDPNQAYFAAGSSYPRALPHAQPRSLPGYSTSLPASFPPPSSLHHQYNYHHQMAMSPPMAHPYPQQQQYAYQW